MKKNRSIEAWGSCLLGNVEVKHYVPMIVANGDTQVGKSRPFNTHKINAGNAENFSSGQM